uniref:Conserved oligomeric Golgi complex subunit 6 n=1 Tax=Acrobeloides nanus TaxID=290746 RepID=A0A914EH67_9BILA
MLNCLNAIKSVIILYQYTDTKLEMIKAQIDANEDVLVSEQASLILTKTGLVEIYTKCLAHQPNQGPLSKISGMEAERISSAVSLFNAFLERPDGYQCNQVAKISSTRIRESIQVRTMDNVIRAYNVILTKIKNPDNLYPEVNMKTVEEIKEILK